MSERKVLNKYYPPDFDPSKIPRMKLAKNRQYTVRLMAPFNMRCKTCGEYIYKGKKFNARKEDVENETYLGIRIYRFYIKCTRCLQEISFKTDPQNTDYEIEAGATRNFMALKLAEEQARREEDEAREEEANNPMKLLENRTQQSRNEIELLESLEELRDLNQRQQVVDYESMLRQYNNIESEQDWLKRQEREDEEYIKSVDFKSKSKVGKIVVEEIIEEIKEETKSPQILSLSQIKPTTSDSRKSAAQHKSWGIAEGKVNPLKRKMPLVLVKSKTQLIESALKSDACPSSTGPASAISNSTTTANALSLLGTYSDSSSSENAGE